MRMKRREVWINLMNWMKLLYGLFILFSCAEPFVKATAAEGPMPMVT